MEQGWKTVLDLSSYGVVFGVIADILPNIAAVLSIVWLCLQIYTKLEDRANKAKEVDSDSNRG